MERLLSDPDIVQRMRDLGVITAAATTPAALVKSLHVERERWAKLVRELARAVVGKILILRIG